VPQPDFITAFGRLLRDGALRDAYAISPAAALDHLNVQEAERSALANLNLEDLEAQARVLLRKRFEIVQHLIPQTCSNLADQAWPQFAGYSRSNWPSDPTASAIDAQQFLAHLQQSYPELISTAEENRVRFALGTKRVSLHFLPHFVICRLTRPCLQLFVRWTESRWCEYVFYLAL